MTRCGRRVLRFERIVTELLRAWDNSEAENVRAELDKLRRMIEEI